MDSDLSTRLQDEIGKPYIDIENGFTFGADTDLNFIVAAEHTAELRRGDPLLVYDMRDEIWYGVEVKEIQIMETSTLDRERELYAIDREQMISRYEERGETFDDPAIVRVEPIASFQEGKRRAASKCPSSASVLLDPKPTQKATSAQEEPPLREILGIPEAGVPLGAVSINQRAKEVRKDEDADEPYLDFRLDLDTLGNKHAIVFGASGQGKTAFLKYSSKRLFNQGYGIIFFDIQGDILQGLFDIGYNEDQQEALQDEESFHSRFYDQIGASSGLDDDTDITVYFPVTEGTDEQERKKVRQLCEVVDVDFREFSLRFRNIHSVGELAHYIEIASDLGQEAISEMIYNGVDKNLQDIIKIMEQTAEGMSDKWGQSAIPEIGINTRHYRSTLYSALKALRAVNRDGVYDQRDVTEPTMYGNAGEYNLVYLAHLNSLQTRQIVEKHVMGLMREKRAKVTDPGVYIIVDEAHEIVPAESTTASSKQVTDRLVREFDMMAREGRKYNINLMVSTHYPGDIDDVVQNICDTKIVMGISEQDARRAEVPDEYQKEVSQLNQGYAYVNTSSSTTSPWTEIRIPWADLLHMDISRWNNVRDDIIEDDRDEAVSEDEQEVRDQMGI